METKVQKFEQAVKALQWRYTKAVMARIEADEEDPRYVATPEDTYNYEEELDYFDDFMNIFGRQDLDVQHYIITGQGGKNLQDYFEGSYWAMIKYIKSIY
jgi:hypothetical protein